MNVILDLDNTLLCAIEMDYYKKHKKEFELLDQKLEKIEMDISYRIYERPNLHQFLEYVFSNFNVCIFTAASKDYALFIFDNIIKKHVRNATVDVFLHYYHTEISEQYYNSPKDLRLLWEKFPTNFKPSNTIIVDDLKDVKDANGYNCINIKGFEVVDEDKGEVNNDAIKDNELLHVMDVLELAKI